MLLQIGCLVIAGAGVIMVSKWVWLSCGAILESTEIDLKVAQLCKDNLGSGIEVGRFGWRISAILRGCEVLYHGTNGQRLSGVVVMLSYGAVVG